MPEVESYEETTSLEDARQPEDALGDERGGEDD